MNNLERLIGERLYLGIRAIFYFKFMFALAIFFGKREVTEEDGIQMIAYLFGTGMYVVAFESTADEEMGETFDDVLEKIKAAIDKEVNKDD